MKPFNLNDFKAGKKVVGYDMLYYANVDGSIYSIRSGKKLSQVTGLNGYSTITLCKEGKPKTHLVHRIIAATFFGESSLEVDHINGIKNDNRVDNLRYCTRRENTTYTNRRDHKTKSSQYPGVCIDRSVNKWKASTNVNGKNIHLGNFDTEIEAYNAYKNYCNTYKLVKVD